MWIPLLTFWSGPSFSDFHKTSEDPSCLIKEDQCKNNNIFGRHVSNGPNVKKISQAKQTFIFLLQNLGFAINLKKLQLTPVKEIEFLGLVINSVNMTLAFYQEKVLDIQNKCA